MFMVGKYSLSSFNILLRLLIAAVFLIGLLPVPALAAENGTIAGMVTNSSTGNPISGIAISVFTSGSQQPSWAGNTDGTGNYSLSIPPGSGYEVEARQSGYITQRQTGNDVSANTTTTVNFSLVPGGIIEGTVTDNSSSPIQNAGVACPHKGYHFLC